MADYEPQEITCVNEGRGVEDCEGKFVWGTKDQEFYAKMKYSKPKRCRPCAKTRRAEHNEQKANPTAHVRGNAQMSDREMFGAGN